MSGERDHKVLQGEIYDLMTKDNNCSNKRKITLPNMFIYVDVPDEVWLHGCSKGKC